MIEAFKFSIDSGATRPAIWPHARECKKDQILQSNQRLHIFHDPSISRDRHLLTSLADRKGNLGSPYR